MIDIENQIVDMLIKALRDEFQSIYVYGEAVKAPAGYPCVTIVEQSNTVAQQYIDSGGIENAVDVMYEVNIYSNLSKGKKQEAKKIRNFINDVLDKAGFVRTISQPVTNLNDISIYRILSRYEARIDDNFICRR